MMTSSNESNPRDSAWAKPVDHLDTKDMPAEALNLNVDGRGLTGPLQGFGQLWQKTYKVRLTDVDVSPTDVVAMWKGKLPEFMPDDSRFYPSFAGVAPGEILLINATLPGPGPGITVSTGVMILYADDESFTVMTPDGHPESGFNTFSSYEEDGVTVAQIQSLARANDPVYEFGFRFLGGSGQQEAIWHHVLTQLANNYGISGRVETNKKCVDSKMQWSQAKNVWHNAVIRTTLNAPVRATRRLFGG
jgi:hypothetical protein